MFRFALQKYVFFVKNKNNTKMFFVKNNHKSDIVEYDLTWIVIFAFFLSLQP